MFKARTGIDMVHVPYRGQAQALEDLIGGRIAAMFPIVPDVIAAIRADQVRALALGANSTSAILPDVPLMAQLGYPDLIPRLGSRSMLRLRLPRRSSSDCARSSMPYWRATLLSSG
jgi:tripartite-type tricarboxylate transporter receptor subunit TctC